MIGGAATKWLNPILIAAAYVFFAQAGFRFGFMVSQISPVWPPSGFALAVLIIGGVRLWPGLFLGAFAANYISGVPAWAAGIVGAGNTLEAVAGTLLLMRLDFRNQLVSLRDVLLLMGCAAAAATSIAATTGTTTLCAAGVAPWSNYLFLWATWWVGDGMGILLLTPLILAWFYPQKKSWTPARIGEAAVIVLLIVIALSTTFGLRVSERNPGLHYIVFPFVAWAALRFRLAGATAAALLISIMAVALTVRGFGPFIGYSHAHNLLLLQAFIAAVASTGLILGAVAAERARLHEELLVARDGAIDASRAKSAFLTNMSHELRTPLTAVIGYTELLEEDLERGQTQDFASDLAKIHGAANHLLGVITGLLDLSRIEAGRVTMSMKSFPADAPAREAAETVRPLIEKNHNRLEIELDGAGEMFSDPVRLKQILLNLLGNAAKFTENGAVRLSITGRSSGDGDVVVFNVSDTGIGIPEDQLAQLFEQFHQVDPTRGQNNNGSGLGLAISRGLAHLLGGEISVDSKVGKGSVFTLEIPRNARGS